VVGRARISIVVAILVDTNILVYRFDPRFPEKQASATDLLRRGIVDGTVRIAHQAIVEFVAATTRAIARGPSLLSMTEALREAEDLMAVFPVLYPNDQVVRTALRGAVAYQLSWFDAHMWAFAEFFALNELVSEDFQHDRIYGTVRIRNPFVTG
jgi:predicted nucleic acid-binding protein